MRQGLLNLTSNNRNSWNVTQNCCHDLLLNMNLIPNLGKFQAIRLWIWPSKVSFTIIALNKKKFKRRFRHTFDFNDLFFQALFKRCANNKHKLHESSLLYILYYIYSTPTCPVQRNALRSWWHQPLGKTLDLQC